MAEVRVGENETFESALRRFNKKIQQSGILAEARRREHYEKPSVKASARKRSAARTPERRLAERQPRHKRDPRVSETARGSQDRCPSRRLQSDIAAAMRGGDIAASRRPADGR